MGKRKYQYAIKYKVKHLTDDDYMFVPDSLVIGKETKYSFNCLDGNSYSILVDKMNPKAKVYVDMIYTLDELEVLFPELEGESEEFKAEYFYEMYQPFYLYINTKDVTDLGVIRRHMIDRNNIDNDESIADCFMSGTTPSMLLNGKAVNEIMESKDFKEAKLRLTSLKLKLKSVKKLNRQKGVTLLRFKNGKIDRCVVNRDVDVEDVEEALEKRKSVISNSGTYGKAEISYLGLRDYLKKKIYGHDEEIDTFAQKLYMNCTAVEGEHVDSMLLVGPTGTGKTKTVEYACKYLGIPMIETNASNLVTEGIKGTSLEKILSSLYELSGGDIKKAQRGLVFLDEYDKLHNTDLDIKAPVKDILLTFIAGGKIPVSTDRCQFMFDSTMTNKLFAGVFERISEKQKNYGFNSGNGKVSSLGTPEEIREKIIEKKYMTLEELSRISTVLGYDDLSDETKKDILLHCEESMFIDKRNRYKRQFLLDLEMEEAFVDELITYIKKKYRNATGMRPVYNEFNKTINKVEQFLLENKDKGYKTLVLTRDTVADPDKYYLSK